MKKQSMKLDEKQSATDQVTTLNLTLSLSPWKLEPELRPELTIKSAKRTKSALNSFYLHPHSQIKKVLRLAIESRDLDDLTAAMTRAVDSPDFEEVSHEYKRVRKVRTVRVRYVLNRPTKYT